jgi:hypothetical protein
VRRFVGYERHAGMAAGQCLARLYQSVRLFVNYFQPSMKLRSKTRMAAKVTKSYHKPATACMRLLAHPAVAEAVKERLRAEQSHLDPLDLLQRIRGGGPVGTPLAHRRPGYPSSGCSPAEPDSVSPGFSTVADAVGANKAKKRRGEQVRFCQDASAR